MLLLFVSFFRLYNEAERSPDSPFNGECSPGNL
jgi:hypothetical protein